MGSLYRRMTILNATQLKADFDSILDRAAKSPQYVTHNGRLLVITKAKPVRAKDTPVSPWELRSGAIESFYDPAKIW